MIRNLLEDEFKQIERGQNSWLCLKISKPRYDLDWPRWHAYEHRAGVLQRIRQAKESGLRLPRPSRHQNEYLIQPGLALIGWPCIFQVWDAISTDTCSLKFLLQQIMRSSCGPENLRGRGVFVLISAFPRLTKDRFIQHPVQYSMSLGFYFQDFLAPFNE